MIEKIEQFGKKEEPLECVRPDQVLLKYLALKTGRTWVRTSRVFFSLDEIVEDFHQIEEGGEKAEIYRVDLGTENLARDINYLNNLAMIYVEDRGEQLGKQVALSPIGWLFTQSFETPDFLERFRWSPQEENNS